MTAQTLVHDEDARRARGRGLFQMGWPQFWLLGGILAGLLALCGFVLLGMAGLFS